ncbi:DMT family transporter [Dechloromonas sp. ZY10]|uniref:DMT family transporter n=1 Tax=Dechloromonas aquae TaxID=2664436 RepID=UPI0035272182
MSIPAAYLGVVLIWSTTPLAIQWSTQGTDFAFAVFLRMLIGCLLAATLVAAWRIGLPLHSRARRAYLVGGLSLFVAMSLTYWGARHIHSGLVSLIFGLAPLLTGLFARYWLPGQPLHRHELLGAGLGVGGLALIFAAGRQIGDELFIHGLLALLAATAIYSAGLVGLKRIGDDSPPLATTLGTLAVALPLFGLLWLHESGGDWALPPARSLAAIVYLGVFGSVLGFALYYYVIKHLAAARVALITLITPVLALLLGHWLNGEEIGLRIAAGTALVLGGLLLHQWPQLQRSLRPAAAR